MSIRVILCFLFVLGFSIYAWRNWFVSLCAAIVLMAVLEHPDMPKSIAGIPGFNLWNVLMGSVLMAWWVMRRREALVWDMPRHINWLLILYALVVAVGFVRLLLNPQGMVASHARFGYLFSEYGINTVKWVLPGMLLFDACRTRERIHVSLVVILTLYLLLALQVIRWVPVSYAVSGGDFSAKAYKKIQNEIGYNRVTLSMMLGGASWAVLATLVMMRKKVHQLGVLTAAGLVTLAQALTGGRTGYASWAVVGLVLSLVRWRKLLLWIPVVVVAVMVFLPGVRDRLLQGIGGQEGNIIIHNDAYEITSGRTIAWPHVIKYIEKSPILGYGREAMATTGLRDMLQSEYNEGFSHPHNAYLQMLLDNGLVGFVLVIPFYLVVLWHGLRLLLEREESLCTAVGGVACSLILALLVGSMGGQTFYPREGAVGLWAAIGVMLRVSVERSRARRTDMSLFGEQEQAAETIVDTPENFPQPA